MRGPILTLASVLALVACTKEENPFDAIERPAEEPVAQLLPLDNFAGLHQRIFRPTCAVSGCHDGTFEPEFRSIAGAYNSLVLHPVTANDPQESFTYRHRWKAGDLVIFNNPGLLHRSYPNSDPAERVMHRTTVQGEVPA